MQIMEVYKKPISLFNWEKAFENVSVNDKVDIFISFLLNVFRARQIALTVTSVSATCTQRGYRVHEIMCL